MNPYLRVVLCGFSDFEQRTLGTVLRLAGPRSGSFVNVAEIADADLIVADADVPAVLASILGTAREADTVFIGMRPPAGSVKCLRRPIDPMQVLRELNRLRDRRLAVSAATTAQGAVALPTIATVIAPAPQVTAAPTTTAAPAQVVGVASTDLAALVVDDSTVAAHFLRSRLLLMGLDVEVASNSQHALELLASRPFAWVFLDVELGEGSALDGLALCQHIKRWHLHPESTPPTVVMVSAHQSPLDRVRGTFAGCDHYLAKPVDEVALRRLVLPPAPKAGTPSRRCWPASIHRMVPSRS